MGLAEGAESCARPLASSAAPTPAIARSTITTIATSPPPERFAGNELDASAVRCAGRARSGPLGRGITAGGRLAIGLFAGGALGVAATGGGIDGGPDAYGDAWARGAMLAGADARGGMLAGDDATCDGTLAGPDAGA